MLSIVIVLRWLSDSKVASISGSLPARLYGKTMIGPLCTQLSSSVPEMCQWTHSRLKSPPFDGYVH